VPGKRNARLPLGERRKEHLGYVVLRNGRYLTRCRVIHCKKGGSDVRLMRTEVYAGFVLT
jgi:hypothetical protein